MTNPGGPLLRREDFNFRTDNVAAQLAALRAGIGIGAVQTPIAQRDPDLAPVLADAMRFEREIWLVMHEDQARIRRIRLLFDALAKGLSDYLR
jgi:DNA-binding transcriptional LysR family regulator